MSPQVLNVAGNKLRGTLRIRGVPKLRALIANDNEITAVKGRQSCLPDPSALHNVRDLPLGASTGA